jgi:hypothetical protein
MVSELYVGLCVNSCSWMASGEKAGELESLPVNTWEMVIQDHLALGMMSLISSWSLTIES